jgi:hypothetical protein
MHKVTAHCAVAVAVAAAANEHGVHRCRGRDDWPHCRAVAAKNRRPRLMLRRLQLLVMMRIDSGCNDVRRCLLSGWRHFEVRRRSARGHCRGRVDPGRKVACAAKIRGRAQRVGRERRARDSGCRQLVIVRFRIAAQVGHKLAFVERKVVDRSIARVKRRRHRRRQRRRIAAAVGVASTARRALIAAACRRCPVNARLLDGNVGRPAAGVQSELMQRRQGAIFLLGHLMILLLLLLLLMVKVLSFLGKIGYKLRRRLLLLLLLLLLLMLLLSAAGKSRGHRGRGIARIIIHGSGRAHVYKLLRAAAKRRHCWLIASRPWRRALVANVLLLLLLIILSFHQLLAMLQLLLLMIEKLSVLLLLQLLVRRRSLR